MGDPAIAVPIVNRMLAPNLAPADMDSLVLSEESLVLGIEEGGDNACRTITTNHEPLASNRERSNEPNRIEKKRWVIFTVGLLWG